MFRVYGLVFKGWMRFRQRLVLRGRDEIDVLFYFGDIEYNI